MKRITNRMLEQAHDYMSQWIDSENWTDLNVMLDHAGATMLASYHLVSAGAIDSKRIKKHGAEFYPETALESELIIEELAKRFRKSSKKAQSREYNQTFKDCFIADCQDCGHVSFLADGNETLYPETKAKCWSCGSTNIKTKHGLK